MNTRRLLHNLALWSLVCIISAAPSFMWGTIQCNRAGMACGVATYILLYTAASMTETCTRITARPFVKRTLRIGYCTRIAISAIFPVGLAVDLFPGMLAMALVARVIPDQASFGFAFCTTLVQGAFVNVLLGIYMLIVYEIQVRFLPAPVIRGLCPHCGYDLRATRERCPECGTPVPPGHEPTVGAA